MTTIQIVLQPDEERVFLDRARVNGQDPGEYARQIIRHYIKSQLDEMTRLEASRANPTLDDLIDHDFVATCSRRSHGDAPAIEAVRQTLAKIPGSLADEIIADREDRF